MDIIDLPPLTPEQAANAIATGAVGFVRPQSTDVVRRLSIDEEADLAALRIIARLRANGWAFSINIRGVNRGGIFLMFDHATNGAMLTSEGDTLLAVAQDAEKQALKVA